MPEVLVSRTRIVVAVGVLIERTARSPGSANVQTAATKSEARVAVLTVGPSRLLTIRHTLQTVAVYDLMKSKLGAA